MSLKPLVFLIGAALAAPLACAENLSDIYQDAVAFDAQYASARAVYQATQEKLPQARAGLLPAVSANANVSRNHLDTSAFPPLTFTSNSWGVNGVQPIFRWQNWVLVDEAQAQLKAAAIQLKAAEQDLVLRTAQAYFDVLQAEDNIDFIRAQKAAIAEQLASAKRSFEVGTATITDTNEAQARFDLATAQEIAAQNDLEVRNRALFKVTGKSYRKLARLNPKADLKQPEPVDMDAWASRAQDGNVNVVLQRYLKTIADEEIRRTRAGHYPTLDLTASYTDIHNQSTFGATQIDSKDSVLGLELNIPIYQGGLISSQVREAVANQEKARRDLDNALRDATLQTNQAFLNAKNGIAQVKALEQALVSSQVSLDSTQLGLEVGVRTNVDVLNAQQQVYSARKDLAAARYTFLLSVLNLKAAAGMLSAADLDQIDSVLTAMRGEAPQQTASLPRQQAPTPPSSGAGLRFSRELSLAARR
ncbi:MAG TPA: TolC family outer membrane protein [Thiobacillaceae bacterium]|nr:TolC family outer membrane protein [Thiobacillaceae bacterium]